MLGKLPPTVFAELHKQFSTLHRSLSSASKNDKLPLLVLEERLPTLLPGASAAQHSDLIRATRDATGGSALEYVRLETLVPPPKEPSELPALGAAQMELHRIFLDVALTLRDDLEASIRRSAIAFIIEKRAAGRSRAPAAHTTHEPQPLASLSPLTLALLFCPYPRRCCGRAVLCPR